MFQHTKSAMEGADTLHLLSRVEQKLDELTKEKESYQKSKNVKPLEDAEKKVKGEIQNKKQIAKDMEKRKAREDKVKEKEKRFKTAQDKILKGKERMRPTRIEEVKKAKKETKKKESDSFEDKYFEAPN